ncbi:hypothetical protein, partial [Streptococcus pneumoniae]
KTDFYRPEYQKRKDEICPFSSLAFFQPTTVDKEPLKIDCCRLTFIVYFFFVYFIAHLLNYQFFNLNCIFP